MSELLRGAILKDLPSGVQATLKVLHERMNLVRKAYNKPMIITSGLRTKAEHTRIYAEKGVAAQKVPWGSQHLFGGACDVADPKGELAAWCLKNVEVLEKAKLWCEDPAHTRGWMHFQVVPPRSGNRFFKP